MGYRDDEKRASRRWGSALMAATSLFLFVAPTAFGQAPKRVDIVPDRLEVEMWLDAEEYRVGDPMVVSFRSNRDAFVTIFNIASDGSSVRLFPNRYDRVNRVLANRTYRIPAPGYELRVSGPPGLEKLEAHASTDSRHGLRHFEETPYQEVSQSERGSYVKGIQIVPARDRDSDTVAFRVTAAKEATWRPGESFVTECYEATLGRPPSRQEAIMAVQQLQQHGQKEEAAARLVQNLLGSDEYFVRSVYSAVLGREADRSGLEFHLRELQTGRMTRYDVIVALLRSEEFQRQRESH
jgi:hypothetical protein